jgi:hypothetical protein
LAGESAIRGSNHDHLDLLSQAAVDAAFLELGEIE